MIAVFLFLICILASSIGAVVGAGGGVIIKPVLDMTGMLPVSTERRMCSHSYGNWFIVSGRIPSTQREIVVT